MVSVSGITNVEAELETPLEEKVEDIEKVEKEKKEADVVEDEKPAPKPAEEKK